MKDILVKATMTCTIGLLVILALILYILTIMYIDKNFNSIDHIYRSLHMVLAWSAVPIATFTLSRFLD